MVATGEPPASTRLFTRAFIVLGVAELAYFVAQSLLIAITRASRRVRSARTKRR
jgi:hypothetical protein